MLLPQYEGLLHAESLDVFQQELAKCVRSAGFSTFSAFTLVYDIRTGHREKADVNNLPAAFQEEHSDDEIGAQDPLLIQLKNTKLPIAWDADTYYSAGAADMYDRQAFHGLRSGVAMLMRLPNRDLFAFGMDSNEPQFASNPSDMQRLVAEVQLVAVHAQEAMIRLIRPPQPQPHLTPRETEVLKWTMAGKTAWETSRILSVSERTIAVHISSSMTKLNANNKYVAVLKAIQMGLIS